VPVLKDVLPVAAKLMKRAFARGTGIKGNA
jgi:hypothetical protein